MLYMATVGVKGLTITVFEFLDYKMVSSPVTTESVVSYH